MKQGSVSSTDQGGGKRAASPAIPLAAPILVRLTPNRRCRRVLDLEPMVDSTGAVRRTQPLRDDVLAAEGAGMFEEDCASTVVVLVEGDTLMGAAQKPRQGRLALLDGHAPQVPAIMFDEVERAEHGGMVVTPVAQKVER